MSATPTCWSAIRHGQLSRSRLRVPLRVPLEPTPDGRVARLPVSRYEGVFDRGDGARRAALPKNEYRIRVRKDQAPLVHFEDPPEAWEVNPHRGSPHADSRE